MNILKKRHQSDKNTERKNEYFKDIRMDEVSFEEGENFLRSLCGENIYIKCVCDKYMDNDQVDQACVYTKFKIKSLTTEYGTILIYGNEDEDRLVVDKINILSMQITPNYDEILLLTRCKRTVTKIYIKKYLPLVGNRLNEIAQSEKNIIITEGKTDWKHLKNALHKFKENGKYTDIDFDFFEYENEVQMGADTLLKVCEYNRLFYNHVLKIFIFDADREDINKLHEGKVIKDYGNNVFSIIIPVPEFRKSTPLISIENYYTDEEIMTKDNRGYRLFLNSEFDHSNGFHKDNSNVYDCHYGKHKKMGDNYIIDTDILKVENLEEFTSENIGEAKKKNTNIALTKNKFANYVLSSETPFDQISYNEFSVIFDVILKIIPLHIKNTTIVQDDIMDEKEIIEGIYLKKFNNGLMALEINIESPSFLTQSDRIEYTHSSLVIEEKQVLKFSIQLGDKGMIDLSIPLNEDLLMFMIAKSDNKYNRIEIFIHEESERVRMLDLYNTDEASTFISRELRKLGID